MNKRIPLSPIFTIEEVERRPKIKPLITRTVVESDNYMKGFKVGFMWCMALCGSIAAIVILITR